MRKLYMSDERYYSDKYYPDSIACDYHSVDAGLEAILGSSLRLGYVDEDYTNLCNNAAYLSNDLYQTIREFSETLPPKGSGWDEEATGIYWFNSAMALYNGCDMDVLLENEEKYDDRNEYKEKSVRLRAVNSLTKEQHLLLLTKTYKIVFRYIQLKSELNVLIGIDDELERLHSFKKKKDGSAELPKSAWV